MLHPHTLKTRNKINHRQHVRKRVAAKEEMNTFLRLNLKDIMRNIFNDNIRQRNIR